MTLVLPGTPSDQLPAVLATGSTDASMIFASMSARESSGRDAEYLEWHSLDQFNALSAALGGERRPFRLPSVDANYFRVAGKVAAPRAIAGADVIPWRAALGVYLIVEQGTESPAALVDVPGVAGIWWHVGGAPLMPGFHDNTGMQLAYCFLDDDPVATAERLRAPLQQRWATRKVTPLLAAPFHVLVPFEWNRYLP